MTRQDQRLKKIAEAIFNAGIQAVDPETCVSRHLKVTAGQLQVGSTSLCLEDIDRILVLGVGKASAAMAHAAEAILGPRLDDGLVITKYGHGVDLARCRLMEAGHPVPDLNGVRATRALLDLVSTAGPDDLILCMISGGGSALAPAPARGISLQDKQATTRLLLGCGATIHEVNTLRKHLSQIKGGQLCRCANGARIISLILSDVIGDDLDIIASGITAPDHSRFGDCMEILSRYDLWDTVPDTVRCHLTAGCRGQVDETPKPGGADFHKVHNQIVGSVSDALRAAEKKARQKGFTPIVLSSMIQGEASEVARVLCAVAKEVHLSGRPVTAPACILCGGETTVTLKGSGIGGRNMELALAAGIELAGTPQILVLSAGTDGTDGPTDAAGAFASGSTLGRARALGLSAHQHLAVNNAYEFFQPLGELLVTGPTRTNVMDLQILLVDG